MLEQKQIAVWKVENIKTMAWFGKWSAEIKRNTIFSR